ncbi:zinc ribbon domain-containing protein [Spiractinospora alimapuensis]|uniref:FmdB family zinc ribbon protein n=1 Tax=Spiractinospora alimapuensis TaxID=2820884 RepID=UPI001F1724C8|nr:zinc ribbon domain-containing protein [Spiractinospora alimapuensis]QVQ52376.1 zinc ribbon domain-containing protein [Spiractinospora alimapuensis]
MPIYDFACDCGARFEALVPSFASPAPPCGSCGRPTLRRPPAPSLAGRADPGPGWAQAPRSWEATNRGDPETLNGWRRALERRQRLEEKYPELAGDRRPVLAHEGRFAADPLRAGDPVPTGGEGTTPSPPAESTTPRNQHDQQG